MQSIILEEGNHVIEQFSSRIRLTFRLGKIGMVLYKSCSSFEFSFLVQYLFLYLFEKEFLSIDETSLQIILHYVTVSHNNQQLIWNRRGNDKDQILFHSILWTLSQTKVIICYQQVYLHICTVTLPRHLQYYKPVDKLLKREVMPQIT